MTTPAVHAIIYQGSADTTQWHIFRDKWQQEDPAPHDRDIAFVRSHRRPRRISLEHLMTLLAGVMVTMALMTYSVAILWEAGVPLPRLLSALAATVIGGVTIAMTVCRVTCGQGVSGAAARASAATPEPPRR